MTKFNGDACPLLIGSLPMDDHREATELILASTPEIPLWAQLPMYQEEGMIPQFLPGMPGLAVNAEGKTYIDTAGDTFDAEYLAFYEEYLAVAEGGAELAASRFILEEKRARGFKEFLRQVDAWKDDFKALKGQVTGPITFATGVTDQDDRAIFYNDQLRDAAIKHLAMNGRWQAMELARRGAVPIIFFDEPALAGFGTSAYITITREDVITAISEVIQGVKDEGGLTGIHVCANTEWDLLLESGIDIINFDAYSYFDKFILYSHAVKAFLEKGGIIAWGIVPTSDAEVIARETADNLVLKLKKQMAQVRALGISQETLLTQSLITPSCGTGSIDLKSAKKVLALTAEVSRIIRS